MRTFRLCRRLLSSVLEGPEWSRGIGRSTFPCLSIPGRHYVALLSSAWASDSCLSAFSLAARSTGSGRGLQASQENTEARAFVRAHDAGSG